MVRDLRRLGQAYNSGSGDIRATIIALLDIIIIAVAFMAAFLLRFDLQFSVIVKNYIYAYQLVVPTVAIVALIVFWCFKLYHSIWSYASLDELIRMILAWGVLGLLGLTFVIVDSNINGAGTVPISVWIMGMFFAAIGTTANRFIYRLIRHITSSGSSSGKANRNVMVIGAGACGKDVIHEYKISENLTSKVCCIIDDNPEKKGRMLEGVEIVGNRNDIPKMVGKYDIAIPAATGLERKDILNICSNTGCKVRVIPGIYQLVDGTVSLKKTRDVQIEDLLGRDTVKTNMEGIRSYINGKVVMVTGGGGSIGSELCRQIAKADPKLLIIFDIYENNAFWIERELRAKYGEKLNMIVLIGSVRNTNRVNSIMETHHPDIIFHAAAHKHVPLMEDSPNEAIKNNVGSTSMGRGSFSSLQIRR